MTTLVEAMSVGRFVDWAMTRYLRICPPQQTAVPGGGELRAESAAAPAVTTSFRSPQVAVRQKPRRWRALRTRGSRSRSS